MERPENLCIDGADVAERVRNFQTRERLTRRAERGVIPQPSVPSARVHPLGKIQSNARHGPPHLPREIGIPPLDLSMHPAQRRQRFENDWIDS
jgi:hypothetical protein